MHKSMDVAISHKLEFKARGLIRYGPEEIRNARISKEPDLVPYLTGVRSQNKQACCGREQTSILRWSLKSQHVRSDDGRGVCNLLQHCFPRWTFKRTTSFEAIENLNRFGLNQAEFRAAVVSVPFCDGFENIKKIAFLTAFYHLLVHGHSNV